MPTEMGAAQGKISLNLEDLRNAPQVAREAGRATAREISNAFKTLQAEQKLAQTQANTTLAAIKAQQTQITAFSRAESAQRIQQSRATAAAQIEAERRLTTQFKSELRAREQAARASQRAVAQGGGGFGGALRGGAGQLAGAFGVSLGVAGAVQVGREVIESTQLATAYGRQEIAALKLAGSQAKLNELTASYNRATGGAIDKATALADVTRLMATGFGKTAVEMERFTRGARGASIAMGKPQDYIIQEVQLAIANTSYRRLDQIGLGIAEVTARMGELRAANSDMTREMAFSEAVLGLLNEKFGALTTSAEGQATGVEKLAKAWKDMRLEIGQELKPDVDQATSDLANLFEWLVKIRNANRELSQQAILSRQQQEGAAVGLPSLLPSAANRGNNTGFTPFSPAQRPRFSGEQGEAQLAAINERYDSQLEIGQRASQAINDETRQAGQQRVSIIANYEKSIVREAEDFGRQRQNAERKHALAILDVAQDSARQRVKWERDLARSIADAQADSAERIDDARKDANKRLAELDKDFKRDQERREEEYRDDMLKAAGQLDAIALLELRKGRARELEDAKEAHKEQRDDLQEQLKERIDEERENLAESIDQQREAHQRQLDEQRENDARRIEEMKVAFAEQKVQEDIERGIRLGRQAEDHNQQLAEFDRAHAERITQIQTNAAKERAQLDEEFQKEMDALGIRTKAYEARELAREKSAIASFDRYFEHMERRFDGRTPRESLKPGHLRPYADGGWVDRTGPAYVHQGEFILSRAALNGGIIPPEVRNAVTNNNSRNITIAAGAITVNAAPGQDNAQLVNMLDNWLVSRLESM